MKDILINRNVFMLLTDLLMELIYYIMKVFSIQYAGSF